MYQKTICSLVGTIMLFLQVAAQSEADLKKSFPDAEAVYTRLLCHVNMTMDKEGQISTTSDYSEDLMYLTDNSVKLMSRGRIYHSSFNELKAWQAYTQTPENKKLKVANATTSNSTQENIFYDDVQSTSFDFAGGITGAIRHIDYQLQHTDAHLLTPHYFDRYFPVLNGELRITFPDKIKLKYLVKGAQTNKVIFSQSRKKDKITYTFKVENFTGLPDYPDAPDNSYYATHVIFYIDAVEQEGQLRTFLSTPDDLYRFNYGFIKNVNREISPELMAITDSLTRHSQTDREKAYHIYRWVQTHIKYVAFEDGLEGFIPREASLVCSRKFGDCKDMASILTAMLRHAGIPAYFTWIGTRDLPYNYTETPLPIVDNHMICTVKLGDDYVFLDGTDNGCIFGIAPYSLQNKQAMVAISKKEFKILQVPVIDKSKNTFTDSTFLEIEGKDLKGKIKIEMKGYWASSFYLATQYRNAKENEDYFKQRFQRGNNKIKFTNWHYSIAADRTKATVTADIELADFARFLGNEIYLNLNLFKWYEHKEIDYPKRKSPIENSFLNQFFYTTVLKLPEGYTLSYLPKSETYKNDVWGFSMDYRQNGRQVALTQQFDTDQLLLYPHQFEQWNKVLEKLYPHYKQTIVIAKP